MAIVVSSIAELKRVMMEQVHEAMERASDDLIDEIKDSIDTVVYDYNPRRYERTESLKKSLRLNPQQSKHNIVRATITIDHDKNSATWASVKSGKRYRYAPETVTYGKYGTYVGEGADGEYHKILPDEPENKVWSKPRDYMAHAKQQLEGDGYLRKCLDDHLPPHITII